MYLQKYWVSKIINILQKCIYIDNTILKKGDIHVFAHVSQFPHKNIKKHNCFNIDNNIYIKKNYLSKSNLHDF